MRKTRKFLMNTLAGREAPDGARFVHVVSRTAGREILFGDDAPAKLAQYLETVPT